MFNLKKQIRTLYIAGILGNLSITGAWVVILSARGFSLVQIGFAETIFHITSLICEIPSGMLADVYGRKKMLVISRIMAILGDIIMFLSTDFFLVCLSMPFHALSFNFASGSGDALAYDSMKLCGAEKGYEKYSSNQSIIYRVGSGISTLLAGLALFLGYKKAYLISAVMGVITLIVNCMLVEVRCDDKNKSDNDETASMILERKDKENKVTTLAMVKKLGLFFADSIKFLFHNPYATRLMFLNSFVGAVDILLLFFLQSKLKTAGISNTLLGPSLLVMELGGVIGARLILKAKKVRYGVIFAICTAGVLAGILLEHTAIIPLMVLGGFISSMSDDAIQIRTDAKLQDIFPSEQRATLISISSFTFSVIMIVLSPLAGFFFEKW
ncbi:MAG: MFS transporter [Lachnospiraceae bacterium]|nr:MFS transporter [Lachnospiraceae bacterium]